ncbi:hypothetical protein ABIB95_005382 [Bradyrhizobium sp. LA2.1]
MMHSLSGFLVALSAAMGLGVGLVHIGFALTEPYPRNIWDWYVVAMGIGMCVMAFPAALALARS